MSRAVSVAVMAHPSRESLVRDLVWSVDAHVEVAWDARNNEWDTGRRALAAYDPTAQWHVVLQDDALVCADLIAGLERALPHVPADAAVSLYVGRAKPYNGRIARLVQQADETGCSWIALPRLYWGVGLVLPTALLDDIVLRADRTHVLEYDRRLSTVFRKMGMPVWYTWPSLVDHRDEPSLLRHDRNEHRRAHRFEGAAWSALTEWWRGPTLTMPTTVAQTPRHVTRRG